MGQSSVLLPWLTPIHLLIIFLQLHHLLFLCPDKQMLALFQFKQRMSINSSASWGCGEYGNTSPYPKTNQWKMSFDCCKWYGVACNSLTGDVIGLDLSCSQLVGVLHFNSSLFQLPQLQRLNLASNDFSGFMIPREFGRYATSLTHLNLSRSNFSGPFPSEISHLSKLVSLDLSRNRNDSNTEFQLKFLLHNLTQLRHLFLAHVPIDSVLPSNLSSSSSLTILDLSYTRLRGELPHEIFILPNLKTLRLHGNGNVTGVLPQSNLSASNGSCITSLRELDISQTMLREVPDVVGSLKSLKSLNLAFCNLSGSIPTFISNLTHLTELHLSTNLLQGQIPNDFAKLVHLRYLSLEYNKLTIGPFPSWVANLSQLVFLDLSDSSLMGPLPSNITGLQKLTILSLFVNSLNGTIPSWIFDLPLLEFLDLGFNQLKCQLSEFQFKSNSLVDIYLNDNELSGFVPQSIFQHVDLRSLFLGSNKLSGNIEIEMFSSLKKLQSLSLSYNNHLSVMLSITNNTIINTTFPNLKNLELSSLKIKEFPYFLRAMETLYWLDLSNNQIHGRVPEWVPS